MNVSLVICTFNRAERLSVALDSLALVAVPPGLRWEVIVVDNNSSDHTREVVESFAGRLPSRYVFEGRQGKSHALNTGVAESRGEVIAFTDDDVEVDPGWLDGLWRAFATHDCAGIGGRIFADWGGPKPSWYEDSGPYRLIMGVVVRYDLGDEPTDATVLPFGANMAFRREVFERHGYFRADLGPVGDDVAPGEDEEFCGRVRDAGERIMYVPDAIIYHPVSPERATKRYYQSWYFRYGRYDVKRGRLVADAVRWFGVPRYLLRTLARNVLGWLTTFESRRRFYYKATVYRDLGRVVECLRLNRRSEES